MLVNFLSVPCSSVIISRQQRRMQVMRIRQRDDRYRNKKKKKQPHGSSHHHQAKQLNAEPAYRRKPNPIRRYDTDVLSPVASVARRLRPNGRSVSMSQLSLLSSRVTSRVSGTGRSRRSPSPAGW